MNARTILTLAPGSSNLHFSEFQIQGGSLTLMQSGSIPLTPEGTPPANREAALARAFVALASSGQVRGRHVCISLPASQAFTKFIRLPRVEDLKLKQMMYFEARQNLPSPPEEMVWDFQPVQEDSRQDAAFLLAGVKPDTIETLFKAAEGAGMRVEMIDFAQASLANAWKWNYSDLPGSSMLVDIGAKTTNLLFFEDDRFYSRTLSLGSHALTQEFMAETRCGVEKAEQFKLEEGFIHPGGPVEISETDQQLLFSKLARQWVTRLHQQIAQTIQHMRSQGHGKTPDRIFLAGMGGSLGGMEEFLEEKFQVPVDLFNAYRKIEIDPALDGANLHRTAHARGETVGIALRVVANCPLEFNLVPKAIRTRKVWNEKKPYLLAGVVCLVGSFLGTGYFYSEIAQIKRESLAMLHPKLEKLARRSETLKLEQAALKKTKAEVDQLTSWLNERFLWADTLDDLQKALLRAEERHGEPGRPAGVWIESMKPADSGISDVEPTQAISAGWNGVPEYLRNDPLLLARYFPELYKQLMAQTRPQFPDGVEGRDKPSANPNQYTLLLRAVNGNTAKNRARNSELAFAVAEAVAGEDRFRSLNTGLKDHIEQAASDAVTFTFGMNLEILSVPPGANTTR